MPTLEITCESMNKAMNTPLLVMETLARLHRRGYQRLRLSAGMSPNGAGWRHTIAPLEKFQRDGYLLKRPYYRGVAFGSCSEYGAPFNWASCPTRDPDLVADLFVERFRGVAAAGRGEDQEYADWFAAALTVCASAGEFLNMHGEYVDAARAGCFVLLSGRRVPLPPRIVPRSG